MLIAAAPYEFSAFTGRVRLRSGDVRWLATTRIGGSEAILAANGIGRLAAATGARRLLSRYRASALISTGFAGGLDPTLEVGQIIFATTVMYKERRYAARLPAEGCSSHRTGSLLTVNEIVRSSRSKRALARGGAHAVDMEAAAVAAVANETGVPFYCVRAISDSAKQSLPLDFSSAIASDDAISVRRVLRQAATRPGAWPGLCRLWHGSRVSARALARTICQCDFRTR